MQQQLARLQAEKEAALAQVKRLQLQQTASTSFLQRTAADVQNTASSAANQNSQLATHVDTRLDEIKALILGAQTTAVKARVRDLPKMGISQYPTSSYCV